jgi:hypothetical protein
MSDTPPPNNVPIIAEASAPQYTQCSSATTELRTNGCLSCNNMIDVDSITHCQLLSLNINLIISADEIVCPIGVW